MTRLPILSMTLHLGVQGDDGPGLEEAGGRRGLVQSQGNLFQGEATAVHEGQEDLVFFR